MKRSHHRPVSDSRSARARPKKDEIHARISAEEGEAARLRSRQLVLRVLLGAQHLQR